MRRGTWSATHSYTFSFRFLLSKTSMRKGTWSATPLYTAFLRFLLTKIRMRQGTWSATPPPTPPFFAFYWPKPVWDKGPDLQHLPTPSFFAIFWPKPVWDGGPDLQRLPTPSFLLFIDLSQFFPYFFHDETSLLFHSNIQSWQMRSLPTLDPYVFFSKFSP